MENKLLHKPLLEVIILSIFFDIKLISHLVIKNILEP